MFFRLFKSRHISEEFFGTREECYVHCNSKMDPENLVLCMHGRVESLQEEQSIDWTEMKKEVEETLG